MSNRAPKLRKVGEGLYRYDAHGPLGFDVWLFDGVEYGGYRKNYVRRRYWCWRSGEMTNSGYATRAEAARAALSATIAKVEGRRDA